MSVKKICWGLLTRQERLGLSWRGRAVVLLALAGGFLVWLYNVQPFLAETRPVKTNVLVMEGWVPEYAAQRVAEDFLRGNGRMVYSTGGPITGTDGSTNYLHSIAYEGAEMLQSAGVPPDCVQMVPAREVGRDRTYTSAVALRDWFRAHGQTVAALNVYTQDAHARRTRLLFQEAFGPQVAVGIIAVPDPDYDPAHWWRYSEGVRVVLGENIAYLYARLLFHPPAVASRLD